MLSIPSSAFQNVFLFGSAKQAFSCKRVSKSFQTELAKSDLWKQMLKIHHPDLPQSQDPYLAMRDLSGPPLFPKIDQFEFVLSIHHENKVCGPISWQAGKNPLPSKFPMEGCKAISELDEVAFECDDIYGRFYIVFHGARDQYKMIKLNLDGGFHGEQLDFHKFDLDFNVSLDVDVTIQDSENVSLKVSLYQEDWDPEQVYLTDDAFAMRMYQALSFDFE